MKNRLSRLLRKYYWMPVVVIAVLGSWWLSIQAWGYLHSPQLVGMFWNPTLHMWEPMYAEITLPEYWNIIMLLPTVFLMWWYSPLYFQIPYALAFLYSLLLAWGYYPCIDVTSGEKGQRRKH